MSKIQNIKISFITAENRNNIYSDAEILVILPDDNKEDIYNNFPPSVKYIIYFNSVEKKRIQKIPFGCQLVNCNILFRAYSKCISFMLDAKYKIIADTGNENLNSKIQFKVFKKDDKFEYKVNEKIWDEIHKYYNRKTPYFTFSKGIIYDSDDE